MGQCPFRGCQMHIAPPNTIWSCPWLVCSMCTNQSLFRQAPLLGRWLLPRVWQHSALSAVSWRSNLHGADKHSAVMATELWFVYITLRYIIVANVFEEKTSIRRQLTEHLFREACTRCSVISDMRRLRKTLTYLLTYLLTVALFQLYHQSIFYVSASPVCSIHDQNTLVSSTTHLTFCYTSTQFSFFSITFCTMFLSDIFRQYFFLTNSNNDR